jgi:hypothetical protein
VKIVSGGSGGHFRAFERGEGVYNPKSLKNLRPFNTYSKEELREISRRAGRASGRARRRRSVLPVSSKKFEKILNMLLKG